jgi:hypothetical protein
MKTKILPLLTALFLSLAPAKGQDNRILTFEDAKALADNGDAYGEALVAFHYSVGWQTEKNPELAAKYALSSTQKGHPLGAFRLGAILRSGEGAPKNEEQGLQLQANSLEGLNNMSGNPYALTALGVALFQGKVINQNREAAAELYKRAADMGFAPAQFNYAMCAEAGHGIPKSDSLRFEYLSMAAELNYNLAKNALAGNSKSNKFGIGAVSPLQAQPANANTLDKPSLAFQFADDTAQVVAENGKLKVLCNRENVLYLVDKKTGLTLGQEDVGPGGIKGAVLSPNSQYLVLHFQNAAGAGTSFPVYELSSGRPKKIAEHWPENPTDWPNPKNEPSYLRNFANKVEKIGLDGESSLVFQCEGRLFSVNILADKVNPKIHRSANRVRFYEDPTAINSNPSSENIDNGVSDGFWSGARFITDSELLVSCANPSLEEIFDPLFIWVSPSTKQLKINFLTLELEKPKAQSSPTRSLAQPNSTLLLGNKFALELKQFHGSRGVGTTIDFGTWAVVRSLASKNIMLIVPDSKDMETDEYWESLQSEYNDRVNTLAQENGINATPVKASGGQPAAFNYENDSLLCKDENTLMIFDQHLNKKMIFPWREHFEFVTINSALTLAAGIKRVGLSSPNFIQLYNTKQNKVIGNVIIGSSGAALVDSEGYYMARGSLPTLIGFNRGLEAHPFEQFDLRLNRPDIVLERLGAPDEAIAIAKQLREKRLKRMGVTEEMLQPDFHLPEIEILGEIPSSTAENELALNIKASDSKYPLDRLRVYVNNVPVNGKEGELLRDAKSQSLERSIPIKLAAGRNKIQLSVLNSAGAESLYANAEITCTASRPKPTLYAVAMGVSEYANPEWNLKYAAKDAFDILARIRSKSGSSYGEVKELLLTDREVTKENLAKTREFLSKATVDDTVLMFVAGHGLLDSKYDYYFGTSDIDFENPSGKGIAFEEFDDLLAELPCLKKSLLIDTCHAGELDEDEKKALAAAQSAPTGQQVAMHPVGARGMSIKPIEGARGKSEWYDRLQGLFVDLRRGSGSTILSSSAGAEYALESSEQKNGLFTYAVLEALDGKEGADANKDGSVTMSELADYVKTRVAALTNNKQSPNVRRVNLEADFTLVKK